MDDNEYVKCTFRDITQDDLFLLVKLMRETRKLLPRDKDECAIERYKLSIMEDLLNKMLAKGIDSTIGHYTDRKNMQIVYQEAMREQVENGNEN